MKNIQFPLIFTTFYLLAYVVIAQAGISIPLVYLLFGLSPVVVIWMVYRVLKDGIASDKEFDDYFYEDSDYRRQD